MNDLIDTGGKMPCPATSHQPRFKGCCNVTFRHRHPSIQKAEQEFRNREEKAESSNDPVRKSSIFPFRQSSRYVMNKVGHV